VLDPSCGDGVFLSAARERLRRLGTRRPHCIGVDIDPVAAAKAGATCADFFVWARTAGKFDVIVGNPPFVRSHLFPEDGRRSAFEQMRQMGLHPSRLMSTWVPFLALSCALLQENGRIGMVIPEELLHVGYAHELRQFLLGRFRRVIVCFPNADLFPSVQQAVVLLLCDNEDGPPGLQTTHIGELESGRPLRTTPAPPWTWFHKWTHLFLSNNERTVVSSAFAELGWRPLADYGRAEVGVVTGDNGFFILPQAAAQRLGAPGFLTPIISSARDLQGISLNSSDFRDLLNRGRPCFLVDTSAPKSNLPAELRQHIDWGERKGTHLRYKCRIRQPWYAVPGVWPADALMLRQAGDVPRLVHLAKVCTSTDTIHRIRWHRAAHSKTHVAGFMNTWTLIACELMGRSYGGGVLELMPREANGIPLPPPLQRLQTAFDNVDALVRKRRLQQAIEVVDGIVKPSSVSTSQYESARQILLKLVARRKNKRNGTC